MNLKEAGEFSFPLFIFFSFFYLFQRTYLKEKISISRKLQSDLRLIVVCKCKGEDISIYRIETHSKWCSQYSVKLFATIRLEAGSPQRSGRKHSQAWERTQQQREQHSLLYVGYVTTARFSKHKQLQVQNPNYCPFKLTWGGGGRNKSSFAVFAFCF